jgi:hypothetical protein
LDTQIIVRFGGGGETHVHSAVAVAMVLVATLIFFVPRRYVIVPFLMAVFLIPMDQIVVVGPFHFQMMRIVILLGWIRLLATKASSGLGLFSGGMTAIDKAFTLWVLCGALNFVLLWQDWGALVNRLGNIYTVLGSFFLLRFLIRDQEDVERTIRTFAYVAVPIAVVMMIEQATGQNPYIFVGGAQTPEREMLIARAYGFRAMASFQHPILAGVFGAIVFPLCLGLWWQRMINRVSTVVGMIAATVIVMASVSSTPLLAYMAAIGTLCLWPLRKQMLLICWGIIFCLVGLHLVMKAPVWALIWRMDVIVGSQSWHRYKLMEEFLSRFGEWFLLGTRDNHSWGFLMGDISNQYVAVGETTGLLPLIFFMAILVYGFKYLGGARRSFEGNKNMELWFWTLGGALFANVVAFFGVSYFDQTQVAWYALLAIICAATYGTLSSVQQVEEPSHLKVARLPALSVSPTHFSTSR